MNDAPTPQQTQMLSQVGLCRSTTKVCCYCKQLIKKKEAFRMLEKNKSQCHYCCSLQYDVGFVPNPKEIKEIFMDFYNFHKTKLSIR